MKDWDVTLSIAAVIVVMLFGVVAAVRTFGWLAILALFPAVLVIVQAERGSR